MMPFCSRKRGVAFRDKLLGNPDMLGKIGCRTAAIANWANQLQSKPDHHGVDDRHSPRQKTTYFPETFYDWFVKNAADYAVSADEAQDNIVLFHTCFGNYNNPAIARDALFVLWKNEITYSVPPMNCCGIPAIESGNLKMAVREAESNFKSLFPFIDKGYKILVLNPTCSL